MQALTDAWGFYPQDNCTNLDIIIKNITHTTCYFRDFQLISGTPSTISNIPALIFPGETTHSFQLSENDYHSTDYYGDPIRLILKYECGEGKITLFESDKTKCGRSRAEVSGLIIFDYNMDTSFAASDGRMRDNTAGVIIWTFSDNQSVY